MSLAGTRFTNCYSESPVCIPARRTLMTGQNPKSHGDRVFGPMNRMPDVATVAQQFRNAGYQADAVGKLHVYPQRDRIGFDGVILDEEGRTESGTMDDYDIFLGDQGYPGRQFDHGMSTNQYYWRPWHLPEELHVTAWAGRAMTRTIKRRDPTKPAFWYLGFRHPHPPLVPPQSYLDLYRDVEIDEPVWGNWSGQDAEDIPFAISALRGMASNYSKTDIIDARRAIYALCTQIDHQIRGVIGTLREEGLLDNTIIMMTSDHGDMLGNHGMVAKRVFYESSTNVPMIVMGVRDGERVPKLTVDHRLVGLQDVMPTLLDLCGINIPDSVDGISMFGSEQREYLYGEYGEDETASRMIRDRRYKLIYYPVGNHVQLFDLEQDPREQVDLSADQKHADTISRLENLLKSNLYGSDEAWFDGDTLVGLPSRSFTPNPSRDFYLQRGDGWPPRMK